MAKLTMFPEPDILGRVLFLRLPPPSPKERCCLHLAAVPFLVTPVHLAAEKVTNIFVPSSPLLVNSGTHCPLSLSCP